MLKTYLQKKHTVISIILLRDFTPRLIKIRGNKLIYNCVCILIKNCHLLPERTVAFLNKNRKNKKLYFLQRCQIPMYIRSRCCIQTLLTCCFLWCSSTNWSWKLFKDQMLVSLPLSSMAHLFSTLTYQNITTFKYVSKRFQLENLLTILFYLMTLSAYSIGKYYSIVKLGIFMTQCV